MYREWKWKNNAERIESIESRRQSAKPAEASSQPKISLQWLSANPATSRFAPDVRRKDIRYGGENSNSNRQLISSYNRYTRLLVCKPLYRHLHKSLILRVTSPVIVGINMEVSADLYFIVATRAYVQNFMENCFCGRIAGTTC